MPSVILIVEDSEPCVTTLEFALLNLNGFETRAARTGHEALAILASCGRDVRAIVTDIHLPPKGGREMDGFELIRRVRADNAMLPILVTSGDSDPGTSERLRRLGANAYFVKPYSPAAVCRVLERLIDAT
jgi:CheY-like chemotaxis protein